MILNETIFRSGPGPLAFLYRYASEDLYPDLRKQDMDPSRKLKQHL